MSFLWGSLFRKVIFPSLFWSCVKSGLLEGCSLHSLLIGVSNDCFSFCRTACGVCSLFKSLGTSRQTSRPPNLYSTIRGSYPSDFLKWIYPYNFLKRILLTSSPWRGLRCVKINKTGVNRTRNLSKTWRIKMIIPDRTSQIDFLEETRNMKYCENSYESYAVLKNNCLSSWTRKTWKKSKDGHRYP